MVVGWLLPKPKVKVGRNEQRESAAAGRAGIRPSRCQHSAAAAARSPLRPPFSTLYQSCPLHSTHPPQQPPQPASTGPLRGSIPRTRFGSTLFKRPAVYVSSAALTDRPDSTITRLYSTRRGQQVRFFSPAHCFLNRFAWQACPATTTTSSFLPPSLRPLSFCSLVCVFSTTPPRW
jgi:hypothetical protein